MTAYVSVSECHDAIAVMLQVKRTSKHDASLLELGKTLIKQAPATPVHFLFVAACVVYSLALWCLGLLFCWCVAHNVVSKLTSVTLFVCNQMGSTTRVVFLSRHVMAMQRNTTG